LESEGGAEGGDGIWEAGFLFAEQGEVGVEGGAVFELEGSVEAAIGVGEIVEGGEGEAEGVVIVGLVRGEGDGFEEEVGGGVVVGALVFEAAEEVEGAGVGGFFFEEFAVVFGGFGEVAGTVLLVGAFEEWVVGHKG
jgi:hypothetical protein